MGRVYRMDTMGLHMIKTKAVNTIIQGGCADIIKLAMVRCHAHLKKEQADVRLLLNVHDELVFEFPHSEYRQVEACAKIMKDTYEHDYLPMDVDIEWSDKSLADKKEWSTLTSMYETSRNQVQRAYTTEAQSPA